MQKERILVIDDDKLILELSQDVLKGSHYEVSAVSDGYAGIKLAQDEAFDVVLTDVKMPNIDGLEVIKQIRKRDTEIPIIVITGHGTLDVAISCLRLGAQGFLMKPFTPAELRNAVSESLEKSRLIRENIRMRALMPLFEVSKEMISEIEPEKLLSVIIDVVTKETRADKAWIALVQEETNQLTLKKHFNMSRHFVESFAEQYATCVQCSVFEQKKPFLVNPDSAFTDRFDNIRETEGISSAICMPLTTRGRWLGLLYLGKTSQEKPFADSEIELVSVLGGQAAAAIENVKLYKKLEESYLSIIVTLSTIVEARDSYTDKHMKDIAEYSVRIASKLRLPDDDIDNIRKAALLHDLGKVSVPDRILLKAGRLSKEEMDIIKEHPVSGARMIAPVEPLKAARDIILHHQECYDGTGYPDRLKGDKIPLGARIIAVADAFGAMTTDRPYRKALSIDDAVRELEKYAGKQFDPEIVAIFSSVLEEKGLLHRTKSPA